jgi:hypothetical protein
MPVRGQGPGPDGQWPEPTQAPTFRTIVEGRYQWGPPWYAPTWGVVYFLYNYRLDDGRAPSTARRCTRTTRRTKRGQAKDPGAHFEEIVLRSSKLSKVQTLAELDPVWRDWILQLRQRETGQLEIGDELLRFAKAAHGPRREGDGARVLRRRRANAAPTTPKVLWAARFAARDAAQEEAAGRGALPRVPARARGAEQDERSAPRRSEARRSRRLDPLVTRYRTLKQKLAEQGLALAKGYETRQLPTMALEIGAPHDGEHSRCRRRWTTTCELCKRTGKSLARWRVAYDEQSLKGWSGGETARSLPTANCCARG